MVTASHAIRALALSVIVISSTAAAQDFRPLFDMLTQQGQRNRPVPGRDYPLPNHPNEQLPLQSRIAIQDSLQKLGLYQGGLDGNFGPQTERAIVAYQRSIKVRQTGFLSAAQVRTLLEAITFEGGDIANAPVGMADRDGGSALAPAGAVPVNSARPRSQPLQSDGGASIPAPASLVETLGLKTLRGDILLASPVVSFEGFAEGIDRLARLLWLKSNPAVIDDPQKTMVFVSLLPPGEQARYASNGYWNGRDQFERDDSRTRFLTDQKAHVLALVPELPLTFAELSPISLGQFNRSTNELALGFSRYSPWPHGSFKVDTPSPLDFPASWSISESAARSMVSMQTERAPKPNIEKLTAVVRYKLEAARAIENGVLLEMVVIDDMKVYDSRRLDNVVATIPLPENTVRERRSTTGQSTPFAILDAMYPRLLAIKLKPELGSNDSDVLPVFPPVIS
jgi:hypothetical protein